MNNNSSRPTNFFNGLKIPLNPKLNQKQTETLLTHYSSRIIQLSIFVNVKRVLISMDTRVVAGASNREQSDQERVAGTAQAVTSRRGLNVYIITMTMAAVTLIVELAAYRPFASSTSIFLEAAFMGLVCIAGLYPIHVAPKTKVNMTTAAIFAVVLLFQPLVAVIVAGAGVALTQGLIKKKSWPNRVFNIAAAVLFTGIAALVYSALSSTGTAGSLASAYGVLCAVVAACAMYMVNSVGVSLAGGFQLHKNPLPIWVTGTRQSMIQEIALVSIGLAGAIVVEQAPWAMVLMIIPVVVIYYSFARMASLNAKVESQLAELKVTQAQLVESARMASIGTMVAGIAHQINNPMFVIRGRAETLCEDADEHLKTSSAKKAVQVIFEMADRVSRIVNSLMPNSHVSEDGNVVSEVNEVVRNTLLLLEPKLLKNRVEVSMALAEGLPPCMGDACEIQEMLINLVDNACNAMPQGGKLALATGKTVSGISISVSDTGSGITPENLGNVFNPFFTTRKGSGGVGLGLYVSKHIAEKYGGSITVESRVGEGTAFKMALPSGAVRKEPHGLFSRQSGSNLVATGSGIPRRER
jgi:signal transduction histidine kinase